MSLDTYWQKRNFTRTKEPRGRQSRRKGYEFVIQKHDARNLHYDFRLELGGVLLSWAVPKGPSLDPKVKRLAMQTEDHPLDYGGFEGVIPKGEYGGGTVLLWDRGTWEPEGDAEDMYRRGRLNFALHGEKLQGSFHLVRTGGGKAGDRRWLLFKSHDAAARPGTDAEVLEAHPESVESGRDIESIAQDPDHVWTSRGASSSATSSSAAAQASTARSKTDAAARANGRATNGQARSAAGKSRQAAGASFSELLERHAAAERAPLPEFIEPELATLAPEAPAGDGWLHEIKLDGYRILARIEDGHAVLLSRRGNDWTARLPSIASALGSLPISSGMLDGEVVVLDDRGVSDFQSLQNSMEAGRDVRCVYFAFDALFLDGHDVRALPLSERKELLRAVFQGVDNPRLRFGDHVPGGGAEFFARACELGLEGIVCKRADAAYSSGRGRSWLKVKCLQQQEFVIGGFTEPAGSRSGLGALLVGVREEGELRYAGKVGTGFTRASLAALAQRLAPLELKQPAFVNPPTARKGVHWVEPRLVAQIAFVERTQDGMIRHASFQGLRDDKPAEEVRLEAPARAGKGTKKQTGARAASASRRAGSQVASSRAKSTAAKSTAAKSTAAKSTAAKSTSAKSTSAKSTSAKSTSAKSTSAKSTSAKSTSAKSPAAKTSSRGSRSARAAGGAVPVASRASGRARKAAPPAAIDLDVSRLEITHPERVLFPERGITKRDLLLYYARVARWMLPHVVERPLMLVRCPEGAGQQCFHQKHPSRGMPRAVSTVSVPQKKGPEDNLMIRDVEGLLGLVQMGALEIHSWGSRADRVECPDQLVFDLDPDEGLAWERMLEAAHALRERLSDDGLTAFPRLTGGKGLHLVVPVEPRAPWEEAKAFCQSVARAMVEAEPQRYVATMTKQRRKGKIFIDFFRNGRGATAVCNYSTRARPGAPVCVPIRWEELDESTRPDRFTVQNIDQRLASLGGDPWSTFEEARAPIPT